LIIEQVSGQNTKQHIVEDEMSGAAKKVIPGNVDVSIYEIMERCSLNEETN
jgi:N-acetylneuraminate synthase